MKQRKIYWSALTLTYFQIHFLFNTRFLKITESNLVSTIQVALIATLSKPTPVEPAMQSLCSQSRSQKWGSCEGHIMQGRNIPFKGWKTVRDSKFRTPTKNIKKNIKSKRLLLSFHVQADESNFHPSMETSPVLTSQVRFLGTWTQPVSFPLIAPSLCPQRSHKTQKVCTAQQEFCVVSFHYFSLYYAQFPCERVVGVGFFVHLFSIWLSTQLYVWKHLYGHGCLSDRMTLQINFCLWSHTHT